jgi:hypothetical protein
MNDRYAEIVRGLLPADEVVTRGAYSLSFAGSSGGVSLKEALDAAHGHEHAADGSELKPGEKAGTDHADKHDHAGASPLWKYVSVCLFVLLLASLFTKLRSTTHPEAP